jgi:hypothetical protein
MNFCEPILAQVSSFRFQMIDQPSQHDDVRGEHELLPAKGAVRVAVKTVGGWLAATIFLLTVSGALPAAINKICRAQNRSVRISSSGLVPVRVDRRVDVIEPDGSGSHGLTAEQIREDEDFASAEAAAIAAAADDLHRARPRHNLPYRAAPFLARADVIRPGERQIASYASPDATAGLSPASYFPPHFNRPPPIAC